MLTVAPLRGASARVEYLFYAGLSDLEREGRWMGRAAPFAGLTPGSIVSPTDLLLCLEGFAPANRARLQHHRKAYPTRLAGWDFTFSVSKSLSLAASVANQPLAVDIPDAFDSAIEAVWPVVEQMLAPNLSQIQPRDDEATPAIGARFRHWRSRHNDPHLHIHVIVPNTCVAEGPNGTAVWRAVDPIRPILGSQDLDRLVQAEVARILASKGYPVALDEEGRAQLPLIPQSLCERYSQGRAAILAAERDERANRAGKPVARKIARGRSIVNTKIRPEKTLDGSSQPLLREEDERDLRQVLLMDRRERPRRDQPSPFERRKEAAHDQLAAEAAQVMEEFDRRSLIGRQVVAKTMRRLAARNQLAPITILLLAVVDCLRAMAQRRSERAAILGYGDSEGERAISHESRRRTFTYGSRGTRRNAHGPTFNHHANTRVTNRSNIGAASPGRGR